MDNKPFVPPIWLKILVICLIGIAPLVVIQYLVVNDPASESPTLHSSEIHLPFTQGNLVTQELGNLMFDSRIFIKFELNHTNGVLPRVYFLVGREYDDIISGNLDPSYPPTNDVFTLFNSVIWFNMSIDVNDLTNQTAGIPQEQDGKSTRER